MLKLDDVCGNQPLFFGLLLSSRSLIIISGGELVAMLASCIDAVEWADDSV